MKKFICIFCLILGIFSEEFSFAAQKKYSSSPTKSFPNRESLISSEERCIAEINRVRQERGLQPLRKWTQLSACARQHSQNMAGGRCPFGHDGFNQRADGMQKQAPLSSFAENVAYTYNHEDPIKISVESWMESPGHKKNILSEFEETGVGIAISKKGEFYITQLFANRRKQR